MSSATPLESQDRQSPDEKVSPGAAPVSFKRPLVALDASDHANRALAEAVRLAAPDGGTVTGIHAYAARLHDRRFKQMEGGLPERYRKEEELEHQREVHDDLITRGLGIISDSYHDSALDICDEAAVAYRRLSPEGKNYRRLVEATEAGEHDFLTLGAVGLGVIPGSVIGTVCERVVRRSAIDTLVIRDPERAIGDGPLVVALDGSQRAFGALMTAFELARRFGAPVHAIAAYDPYFHYVAFDKISVGLSEEAGQEFRFKDQEQLHEEIIDAGIAKIYQSHLDIAQTIAKDASVVLTTELLEGKPYHVINQYLERVGASLLLLGKTGIHADASLDIGGNAENLLRMAPCHMWFSQLTYAPPLEAVAEETISWSEEAEESLLRVPETARKMVRIAVLRFAQESGHTVITSDIMAEATERFCPSRGGGKAVEQNMVWSEAAQRLLDLVGDSGHAASIRLRAEKRARRDDTEEVRVDHIRPFLGEEAPAEITWSAAALARLARVPELVRDPVRRRIEAHAAEADAGEVTLEIAEAAISESRQSMQGAMQAGGHKSPGGET